MTSSDLWDEDTAERYDDISAEMFAPEVLDPAVDFLARLAGSGPALELAIGTGRVAIPLAARGVPVTGIELSQPMVDRLRRKVSAQELPVVTGDMATTAVPGRFSLVYVVWNSIGNLCTQDEQVQCFSNAARHLSPGGRFVVELWVPGIRRFPPGASGGAVRGDRPSRRVRHLRHGHAARDLSPLPAAGRRERPLRRTATSATSGPPSATSWRAWPAWSWGSVWRTGTGHPSRPTARATCRSGASRSTGLDLTARRGHRLIPRTLPRSPRGRVRRSDGAPIPPRGSRAGRRGWSPGGRDHAGSCASRPARLL